MSAILQINNLVKQYNSLSVKAVDGISFEVYEGELFCLLGVNGAGKSTTINIICTLLEKTSGDVGLNGYRQILLFQLIGKEYKGSDSDGANAFSKCVTHYDTFNKLQSVVGSPRGNNLLHRISLRS